MGYKRDVDAFKLSLTNYIISAISFIAGLILIIFSYASDFSFISIGLTLSGLGLYNLATIHNIYVEYKMTNKFIGLIFGTATVIGFIFMLGAIGASFSYVNEYGKVISISIFLGCMLKLFIQFIEDIFPSISAPQGDFFKYCSLLIFIAGCLGFFMLMNIFFDFHYVLLFVGNWLLAYLVLTNVSHFMDDKSIRCIIQAIIFFLAGLGLNLGISLAVNGIANPQFDITKADLFNVASSLYFFLSIVIGIVASVLTCIRSERYRHDLGLEILFLVVPLISFGLQFLAFFYFNEFLIVAGAILVIIALIVLLFKVFIAIMKFIFECVVGIAKGFWYFITFKWVKDVILFFTPDKEKFLKTPNLVLSIEEAARLAAQECGGEFNTINGDTLYFTHCKCSKSQLLSAINKHYVGDATKFIIEYRD